MADSMIDEYQRTLEDDPTSPVFVDLARALLDQGDVQGAIGICSAGLVHHPRSVAARIVWGKALLRQGKATEAREQFEAGLAVDRRDPDTYAAIGEALLQRGLHRSALQMLRRAASLRPDDEQVLAWLDQAQRAVDGPARPTIPPAVASPPVLSPVVPAPADESSAAGAGSETSLTDGPAAGTSTSLTDPDGAQAGADASGSEPSTSLTSGERTEEAQDDGAETSLSSDPTGGEAALPPPLPPVRSGAPAPPPLKRGPTAADLLGDIPTAPKAAAVVEAAPAPEPSAQEAAAIAAAYERELRDRLYQEQARPRGFFRRNLVKISLALAAAITVAAAVGAWRYDRARTLAQDVARYTAAARNGLARDTFAAYVASLSALDEILDRDPQNATAHALKARAEATLLRIYGAQGLAPSAIAGLLDPAAVKAEPDAALVARWLLIEDEATRKPVEEEILAVPPASAGPDVQSLAGAILLSRGEPAKAVERFNAALVSGPGHVPTLVRVADYYRSRSEHDEALRYYDLALAVAEDHPSALLGAGESRIASSRDPAVMRETLASLGKLQSVEQIPVAERPRAAMLRARLLAGTGDRKAALAELEPLQERRDDPALRAALAQAYIQIGAPDRAEALFTKAEVGADAPTAIREAYARALVAQERYRLATTVPAKAGERSLHLLKGIAWYRLGNGKKARASFRATASAPSGKLPADAVVYLSLLDLGAGGSESARKNLERLGTGPRARNTGRWAYAELLGSEGKLDEAEKVLREAIAADPFALEPHCALGRILLARGDREAAVAALGEATVLNPFHTEARLARGRAFLEAKDPARARVEYAAVLEQRADDGDALAGLAAVLQLEGKLDEAQAQSRKAVARAPKSAIAHRVAAEIALARRDRKRAREYLSKAARLDPRDATLWMMLGELQLGAGAWGEARGSYGKVLALRPGLLAAELGIAKAMTANGQVAAAEKRLRDLVTSLEKEGTPREKALVHAALADALLAKGKKFADAAAGEALKATGFDDALAEAHLAWARALDVNGKHAQAAKHHARASALAAELPEVHLAFGWHLVSAGGKNAEAIQAFERYLELAPDGGPAGTVRKTIARLRSGK